MSMERLAVSGSPAEQGRAHGEAFADEIASNVGVYLDRFEHHGLAASAVREQAAAFVPLIEEAHPAYAAEMRGVADGSGVRPVDVALLNVRYEVIYALWTEEAEAARGGDDGAASAVEDGAGIRQSPPEPDGCTSFGLLPSATADGHTVVGQNWDWMAGVTPNLFLLERRREDGPDSLAMTEAGIVGGKIGVNEAGVGLAVNGLNSPADGDDPLRKPFHVRCREALDADRFDGALLPVLEQDRACSANFVVGHAGGEVIDLETAPEAVGYRYPDDDGILTHANHFETDAAESLAERTGPSTLYRAARLRRLLGRDAGDLDEAAIRDALTDHFGRPAAVCRHVDDDRPAVERVESCASVVADLDDRRLLVAHGPPCENEYAEYRLGG